MYPQELIEEAIEEYRKNPDLEPESEEKSEHQVEEKAAPPPQAQATQPAQPAGKFNLLNQSLP